MSGTLEAQGILFLDGSQVTFLDGASMTFLATQVVSDPFADIELAPQRVFSRPGSDRRVQIYTGGNKVFLDGSSRQLKLTPRRAAAGDPILVIGLEPDSGTPSSSEIRFMDGSQMTFMDGAAVTFLTAEAVSGLSFLDGSAMTFVDGYPIAFAA